MGEMIDLLARGKEEEPAKLDIFSADDEPIAPRVIILCAKPIVSHSEWPPLAAYAVSA